MVLDLRLPDMTGFDLLDRIQDEPELRELPIVVFTGKDLSAAEERAPEEGRKSVVIKGVESPERLLDETALFLHRVIADLPPAKRRMVQRLHESDEALRDKRVLVVDDDVRNIFALSSVLERHGMDVVTAGTGQEAIEKVAEDADIDLVLMDIMMPGMDGYDTMRAIRARSRLARAADRRAHRQGDEGRPREVPGSRRLRLPRQTRRHRPVAGSAATVAASLSRSDMTDAPSAEERPEPVNILLVDDQPGRLLTYRAILEPLGENLVEASSGMEALRRLMDDEFAVILLDVNMPGMDGFETAS